MKGRRGGEEEEEEERSACFDFGCIRRWTRAIVMVWWTRRMDGVKKRDWEKICECETYLRVKGRRGGDTLHVRGGGGRCTG